MRLSWALPCVAVLMAGVIAWAAVPWWEVSQWAAGQQRAFQNAMAQALQAIRDGEPYALWLLCGATAAYGVVHAIGPGHGKVLIGGAAFASGVTFRRLAVLTLASSLAQSAMAILLVGALVFGLKIGSRAVADLTETWLAPLSLVAIAAIGALLIWRGLRAVARIPDRPEPSCATHPDADGACGCGHAHGPSVEEVSSLTSWRDAAALVMSIAIRPCTGALFVLVIAARFDAFAAGCLAVLTMGLGTAAFNLVVAGGGSLARRLAVVGQGENADRALQLSAVLHIVGGGLILSLSLLTLMV